MDQQNLRNLRDFLYMYNDISERCYNACITNHLQRALEHHEVSCVERCADKHINANQKILSVFVEVQPQLLQRRLEQQQLQQQQSSDNETTATAATQDNPSSSSPS